MKFLEDDDICETKCDAWATSTITFQKFSLSLFESLFLILILILLSFFWFFFDFIFIFVFVVVVIFVATIFFDFFASFVFDYEFEMFYVTIVDVVINNFTFTISFNFLSNCYDVIFRDILWKNLLKSTIKLMIKKIKSLSLTTTISKEFAHKIS